MKKFLSLVLALVMTMSLVTVSAGAKDFTDNSKINYAEAVDVMSAVKVIDGYADGSFNPSATLTRGAAAKIICNMILGPTTASALVADAAPYKDVPVNHTFAGYIAYCQKTGIISGYADGTFKPANTLTGYAFMKMLLGALGYDAANEGYNSPNWSIAVAKQAINAGLNKGLTGSFNGVKAVNREEACLYAFNTLKATMVEYDTQTIVINNGSVSTNKVAKSMEWVGTEKAYDGDKDGKVQFCEKYFEKLTAKYDTDDFERPVTIWSNDKKEVGTYIRNDLLVKEYTDSVSGLDMYNLLGKSVVEDKEYDFTIAVDGVEDTAVADVFTRSDISKNNKKDLDGTGLGVLTQVFQDTDSKEVYIAAINTYLAQAEDDYDAKKEQAKFTVYGVDKNATTKDFFLDKAEEVKNVPVDNDDIDVTGVKDEEFYLVTLAAGQVQTLEKAQVVAGTEITSFKKTDSVTAGGTKYEYANAASYDTQVLDVYTTSTVGGKINLKETTYNIYLDTYGNLIGVEKVEDDDNYVFIAGVDSNTSNLSSKNYDATAIFTDGTFKTIQFKGDKGDIAANLDSTNTGKNAILNKWCTYTVDKNGVYTLNVVPTTLGGGKVAQHWYHDSADLKIDKKNISLPTAETTATASYGNNDSIYLMAELEQIVSNESTKKATIISGVDSVTTGIKNASLKVWGSTTASGKPEFTGSAAGYKSYGAYTLYKDNRYIIASVIVGEDADATNNLVYVNSSKVDSESYNKTTDEWTWTRKVVLNGEETTLTEVGDSLTYIGKMLEDHWYKVKFNAKGEVVGVLAWSAIGNSEGNLPANYYKHWDLNANEYVTDIAKLADAIKAEDTVLYEEPFTNETNGPVMKSNTLYTSKAMTEGFYVDEDAKVVFIQTNKGKTTTEIETGADKVQGFIESLNTHKTSGKYDYTISAILESGAAKVVVIRDSNDNTYSGSTVTGSTTSTAYDVTLNYNTTAHKFEVSWKCSKELTAGTKLNVSIYTVEGGLVGSAAEYTVGATGIAADTVMGLDVAKTLVSTGAGTYDVVINVGGVATTARLALV